MRSFFAPAVSGALLVGLLAAVAPASADVADVDVTGDLAAALDLPTGVSVSPASTSSAMVGVATRSFNDFPRAGGAGSYAVLSTGRATDLFNEDIPGAQPSTSFGGAPDRAAVSVTVPQGTTTSSGAAAKCLLVDVSMGTEERVHYFTQDIPGDNLSLKLNGVATEYAMHTGPRWFSQVTAPQQPVRYTVNAVQYWHGIDEEFERQPDDSAEPLLPDVTPFDHFTSVDTLEVPLSVNNGASEVTDDVVTLSVQDENNNSLDTVMLVDRVRLAPQCSTDSSAATGLFASRNFEITGHRGVNNTLTIDLIPETDQVERYDAADNGWFPTGEVDLRFRWYRSKNSCTSSDMADWLAINDADRQSFTPSIAEKGKCVLALVTGLKDGYRSETFPSPASTQWKATLPIQDGVFTNVDAPSISKAGDISVVRVNDQLTANNGLFTPRPDSYSYQWIADNVAISGETGQSYRVTASQAGKRIRVQVKAARLNFASLPALSAETNSVELLELDSTPAPTVSGSGRALDDLTAVPGVWQPDPVALTYQWYLDGALISGATSAVFRPQAGHVGKQISVYVTGRKSGYLPVTRQSPSVTVTQRSFVQAPVPLLQGSGYAGDQLTAVAGTWDPFVGPSYQWFADDVAISGANGSTYRPSPAQAGQQIHVVTTGTSAGYTTTSRQSEKVTVRLRQLVGTKPLIVGEPFVGSQLTAEPGTWEPSNVGMKYRWFANGAPIANATSRSFTLTEAQRGKQVSVELTATLVNYEDVVDRSDPVSVDIRRFMTQAPIIAGTLKVGGGVTAQQGAWLPTPTGATYEWYVGTTLVGRGGYLTIPPSAGGKSLRLVMRGTRMYYADATATATSGTVALAALTSSAPTVSGTARPKKVLKVNAGYWGPAPVTVRYQWFVGSKAIKGATKSSYRVAKSYRGKKIRARVTGTKTGYRTLVRYSAYKKIAKK